MRLAFSRGHIIYATNIHAWKYADTNELYDPNNERPCIRCGRSATAEGHDACLGTIPGVTKQMKRACKRAASWIDGTAEFWATDNIHGVFIILWMGILTLPPWLTLVLMLWMFGGSLNALPSTSYSSYPNCLKGRAKNDW